MSEDSTAVVGWAEVSPLFGSAMPFGSCNAIVENGATICGYPRRSDGVCLLGHDPRTGVGA